MVDRHAAHAARAAWPFVGLGGFVLGSALQLQQAVLWHGGAYALLLLLGGACVFGLTRARRLGHRRAWAVALVGGALLGCGWAGARACAFASTALDPALEGRDLIVTGVVAQMPTLMEGGQRFRLDVEQVEAGHRLPPRISLSWYVAQGRRFGAEPDTSRAASACESRTRSNQESRLRSGHTM